MELPEKKTLPIQPIYRKNGPMLNWQCSLAGSSKTAPRILIFPIAVGADFSFYVKSIATYAPAFLVHNNSVLARVSDAQPPERDNQQNLLFCSRIVYFS